MQQASDFLDTSNDVHQLLATVPAQGWDQPTQFKQWTIDDIVGHLHLWNLGADLALRDPSAFNTQVQAYRQALASGETRQSFTRRWLGGAQGPALHGLWHQFYPQLAGHFAEADPKQRVAWLGAWAAEIRTRVGSDLRPRLGAACSPGCTPGPAM